MLMGVSVAFAIRNALRAGREELGISGDANIPNWVDIGKKNIHRILNHLLVCRQRITRTFMFSLEMFKMHRSFSTNSLFITRLLI